jgi:hypothetical protein
MSTSTELRQIALVGPPLAGQTAEPDKFAWTAAVATAFQGANRKDKSLVGSTFGLRVLLHDLATQYVHVELNEKEGGGTKVNATVKLHPPRLLTGHLQARQYKDKNGLVTSTLSFPAGTPYRLRAPVPEPDPDSGKQTLGFFTVAVTPVDPWPTPQHSRDLEVPRLTLAEHRLRVLVNVTGGSKIRPLGFLRFANVDANTVAAFVAKPAAAGTDVLTLPHVELPLISLLPEANSVRKEDFVALDLTPDGIELRATMANPMLAFDLQATPPRLPVVLRLVHQIDPVSPERTLWTLQLVREDPSKPDGQGHQIRDALKQVRQGFVPNQDKPIFVDIDTQAQVPAIRWPLHSNDDGSLSLPSQESAERWRLWVDAQALDVSLTGAPLRGGELPTVVRIAADRLQVLAAGTDVIATLEADRRDPADRKAAPDKVAGPHVVLDWASDATRRVTLRNDDAAPVSWFFDPDPLARELVERYTRRGVQPPTASETHAFLPIADGWLQLPLALPPKLDAESDKVWAPPALAALRDAMPFGGPFETIIPVVGDTGPTGRRLTLLAADRVVAQVKFVRGKLASIQLSLQGAAGTADGMLWFATGSPTPEEVLPSLAAGPASLVGPVLQFRRPTPSTAALSRIDSNTFTPGQDLVLSFPMVPGAKAYVWLAYTELPLITAVPITRTAAGSGLPSQTRGLLCRELDRRTVTITLTHKPLGAAPVLGLIEAASPKVPHMLPLAAPSVLNEITLVAVTSTGIELQPAKALFADLRARLSYQPPLLIDYFASIHLPQTTPPAQGLPEPPPFDTPTSLDMPALFEAWQRAVDRMVLARVKEADAFDDFVPQTLGTVPVKYLFGRTSWSARFGLKTSATLGLAPDVRTLAMGTYRLGDERYSGERALQGLTTAFKVDGAALTPADAATEHPLAIVGFAAGAWKDPDSGMWRDSRAALTAVMPQVARLGNDARGLVYREIRVIGESSTIAGWRATLAQPVPIESPPGNAGRSLALWFRDLFLQATGTNKYSFKPGPKDLERAIGPLQSAFDAEQLPKDLHEWRFCNDAEGQPTAPSLYDIAIGPFRFRPLRLYDLALEVGAGGGVTEATVLGSLSPPGDDLSSSEPGPFGPDPAYRTGNLLAISLKRNGQGGLTFAEARWEKAQAGASVELGGKRELSFRRAGIPVLLGTSANAELGETTLRIVLTFEGEASTPFLPKFGRARMETILFGRRVTYEGGEVRFIEQELIVNEGGEVRFIEQELIVSFRLASVPALPASGVALQEVRLLWSSKDGPRLELEGEMRLQACDADKPHGDSREVVWQQLGEPLWWLNLQVPIDKFKVKVDHQRGTFGVEVDWKSEALQQPVAGLHAAAADIRASLTMALSLPPGNSPSSYEFPSIAGFGALSLLSEDGPTRRFDQVLLAERPKAQCTWTSRIEIDLALESHPSRIHWPVGSLPDQVGLPKTPADIDLGLLASTVSGRALQGRITAYADAETLRHRVTLRVSDQRLSTDLLQVSRSAQGRRVALCTPWSFVALAVHSVTSSGKAKVLSWTTLDHVTAVDARQLVIAARDALVIPNPLSKGDFAFAPRMKYTDQPKESAPALKGGLLLRAFAQAGFPVKALAGHLVDGMFAPDGALLESAAGDGIVVMGAGATSVEIRRSAEGPFWPEAGNEAPGDERHGLLLSLPWLTAVDPDFDFGSSAKKLAAFRQAHDTEARQWDAPDIDWAAGSPMPLARAIAPTASPGSGTAPELAAMLKQLGMSARNAPNLQPVEQLFLRPVGPGASDPITQQPLWLRSLLALRAWSRVKAPESELTMLVPLDAGQVARFRLAPITTKLATARLGQAGQLVAIDRSVTLVETLPPIEAQGGFQEALRRSRLVARAERLVKEPIAVLAVAPERLTYVKAATLWTSVSVSADLDDAALDIPMALNEKDRLYASAALGWPTLQGAALAASGALGLGDDFPFQDLPVDSEANAGDVKTFGSGLSGRVTSLSLPARADNSQEAGNSDDESFIDAQSPVFLALGRKIIFDRPTNLPVVSPPARHLSPTEARAVVPVAKDLRTALARVVQGHAAPIVPPLLERASLGLRPGAMAAEFDMLLFTAGPAGANENFDLQFDRFGRPGHAGPRLLRQHRPPRAPALPRVPRTFVKSHGRRTYVEIDEWEPVDTFEIAKPFLLLEGTGTVLRDAGQAFRIRILDLPLRPGWQGALSLHISSASYAAGGDPLASALAQLGVLHTEARTSLTIDGHVLSFTNAQWLHVPTGSIGIVLTLKGADLAGVRARLDAVDGDSTVFLSFRCGKRSDNPTEPPPHDFDIATAVLALTQETQRHFSLPVPVRPESRPSLPVSTTTLVFADPSYDRALAGPGAADTQRDAKGRQWKLALDRQEYGTDTPLYLAVGPIDATTGLFDAAPTTPTAKLTFMRQPASIEGQAAVLPIDLAISGLQGTKHTISISTAYGITFDRFRTADVKAEPVVFMPGDLIVVSIEMDKTDTTPAGTLLARAKLVSRPIIAPPPAVYALVVPDGEQAARVVLHATAPLPQVIEFPDLLNDLAVGHIRRAALFIWPTQTLSAAGPKEATLVKVDRAGGGQVPDKPRDLQNILLLPTLQ